jgi:magnesium-transporting ATPase (P-type)
VIVIVMVMVQTVYLLNCRPRTRSALSAGLFSNRWMLAGIVATWLAQILFTYLPFMNRLFHSAPVRGEAWLYIVAIGVFTFAVVEFVASIPRQPPGAALTHMTEVAVYDTKPDDRELRYWGRNSPRLTASGDKKA